jgi:hypothetical protein
MRYLCHSERVTGKPETMALKMRTEHSGLSARDLQLWRFKIEAVLQAPGCCCWHVPAVLPIRRSCPGGRRALRSATVPGPDANGVHRHALLMQRVSISVPEDALARGIRNIGLSGFLRHHRLIDSEISCGVLPGCTSCHITGIATHLVARLAFGVGQKRQHRGV